MSIGSLLLSAFGIKEEPPKQDPQATSHCPVCGQGVRYSSGWGVSQADLWREAYLQDHIDVDTLAEKLIALEDRL